MKLYFVTTSGSFQEFGDSRILGLDSIYVLAENLAQAEDKVVKFLGNLGLSKDRVVLKIEYLAEDKEYPKIARIIL